MFLSFETKDLMYIDNIDEYDVSYEKQYMELMVNLLKPYIVFRENPQYPHDSRLYTVNIYRKVNQSINSPIFKKWIHKIKLTPSDISQGNQVEEIISVSNYIDFIQCIFPKMINEEIKLYKRKLDFEECKQDILDGQRKTVPQFKLPMFLGSDIEEECSQYVEELNRSSKDMIQQFKEQNKNDLEQIPEKITYLEKISEINRQKNGSIDSIVNFLKNLHYLEISKTTGGRIGNEYSLPRLVTKSI